MGLKNFEFLFTTDEAAVITRNTILYNLAFIVIGIVLGIFLAILITEVADKTLKKLYQSAILVPFLMSIVIVSYIVYAFLGAEHGLVNNSILPLLGKEPVSWYTQPKYWPFILVFVHTWKGIGYGCLIYISTINGIDKSLYEAASLDGARALEEDSPCDAALPEGNGDHTDTVEYRKDFLCGFRPFLPGAHEFRTALRYDECHRHLRLPGAASAWQFRHGSSCGLLSVGGWLYPCNDIQSDCEEDERRKCAVLRRNR